MTNQASETIDSGAGLTRREFLKVLGAGLLITVTGEQVLATYSLPGGTLSVMRMPWE